jgi:glutamyl/glutaminyl-tRNA synthetase
VEQARYFYADPESYDEATVKKRWKADSAELIEAYLGRLEALKEWQSATLEAELRSLCEERGAGAATLIHPLRLAVSGVGGGPGLFEMLEVLGGEVCVRRLRRAVSTLKRAVV